jgi:F-type H+-transporting ATPase subunit b
VFAGEGNTDIIPRTINFLIFAAILYRFIAEPIKNFLKDRSNGVLNLLKSIQEKVEESKNSKKIAIKNLEDSKILAQNIIEDAKKEAQLMVSKIKEDFKNELNLLQKYHNERKDIEKRKMVKDVITQTVESLFSKDIQTFDNKELVNIVMKKVA